MIQIRVLQAFRFSPDGIHVLDFEPGVCAVTERCAEVATAEGWALTLDDAPPAPAGPPADARSSRAPRARRAAGG